MKEVTNINVSDLTKRFGRLLALSIPELKINEGEIIGLVGNNGAGKTTFFRLILDLLKADSGQVLMGEKVVSQSEEWKKYTGSYLDTDFLIEFLYAEEFFYYTGSLYGIDKEEVDRRLLLFDRFMNGEILEKKKLIRDFSAGNKQKIGIINAILVFPRLLILDEPFNFLDPSSQVEIKRIILDLHQQSHTTVILSSHNLSHLIDISERILLMERGEIIKDLQNPDRAARPELENYFNVGTEER